MPQHCVINGCKTKYMKKSSNDATAVSMHRFPSDPELQKRWIEFVALQNKKPFTHRRDQRLCDLHFSPDAFIDGELKFRSVPTVFTIRHETSDQGWNTKLKGMPQQMFQTCSINHKSGDVPRAAIESDHDQRSTDQDEILQHCSQNAASDLKEEVVDDPCTLQQDVYSNPVAAKDASGMNSSQHVVYSPGEVALRLREAGRKRSIDDFTTEDFETPRKRARNLERLKEIARETSKKLKNSRQTASRWKKKASDLKDIMKEMQDKKLLMRKSKK